MKRHTYYHTCPHCNANLDPGECCDCSESQFLFDYTSEEDAA